MRLPYAPSEPPADAASPDVASIYAAVAARRAPRPLQPLDLTLLHAPPVAQGWNAFLGAVRTRTSLPASVRELAICRVAVLNRAWYEWHHHAPLLLRDDDGQLDAAGLRVVLDAPALLAGAPGRSGQGLAPEQWAVLDYTDQMTRLVHVDDSVAARLREHFDDQKVVEVTAVVAAYACVSRFLVALDVGEGNGKTLQMVGEEGS